MQARWLLLPLAAFASAAYLSLLGPPPKRTSNEAATREPALRVETVTARAFDEEAVTTDVQVLTRWLHEETARGAHGHVVTIVEALGRARAIDTLTEAIDDERHDLALKTLIVQQLGEIGDMRASRAVAEFSERTEKAPIEDEFDLELRHEARIAADETGRRLRN